MLGVSGEMYIARRVERAARRADADQENPHCRGARVSPTTFHFKLTDTVSTHHRCQVRVLRMKMMESEEEKSQLQHSNADLRFRLDVWNPP